MTLSRPNIYEDQQQPWRLSVAPMLDVTDRHCRYFHRLLAPNALLYTEMVTTGALIYGDVDRHLQFNAAESPVALQLGGSEPLALAHCAKLGERYHYQEINLNCGCPSERVQKGAFGACLMAEASLVADCIKAMQDAVSLPVTVKHRLGLDDNESYSFVSDFVGALYDVGCRVFIAHARNAVLKGLSPKDNRQIPPLRYEVVAQLKRDFPEARFILNGGLSTPEQMWAQAQLHDGIMVGRAAWHEPYMLGQIHERLWPDMTRLSLAEVVDTMTHYAAQQVAQGVPLRVIVKPMLGLFNGCKGAKQWRRHLSDPQALQAQQINILPQAFRCVQM
ncbi:tRNA dihydrouridine(20/20a) synthase DusA [Brackiella oedipodis]|uniref:tRNA dihydrouridine(20/20a) synthase DusA n=1 Tax=Brackiella oedipodis TaxID=124225 RepID=UPI0006883045|nr:tRNA dihydrouridine(20/20a) synthase DusA [Brackiella oedipodis]